MRRPVLIWIHALKQNSYPLYWVMLKGGVTCQPHAITPGRSSKLGKIGKQPASALLIQTFVAKLNCCAQPRSWVFLRRGYVESQVIVPTQSASWSVWKHFRSIGRKSHTWSTSRSGSFGIVV